MAEVFKRSRVVPAWLAASRHLANRPDQEDRNVILEIASPQEITAEDYRVIAAVNQALQQVRADRTVMTAAGTIFPQRIYQYYGRPQWYEKYEEIIAHGKAKNTWGTYAHRMISRSAPDGTTFNPLEKIIEKLASRKDPAQTQFKAAYELSTTDIGADLFDAGFELPTYDPAIDRASYMGSPCLSHLTFKMIGDKIDLTAIYRSHYYAERALGNLIGLAQLQGYVAKEAGFETGVLTCVSTHAKLDKGLGGIVSARRLLASSPEDIDVRAAAPAQPA
ncbi:hypothetical protein A9179_21315 [Pseudomonas alcaligenes]|uniref:Thymidylate synthase n=1 Tax=Aquipseudomonas alcaligenes TaxID=43263 RepID=A0ABR7S7W5_AQUAC|nr:hypothetical protein [Pseudomonas alcaligenes]MBC9252812.1 hypothetical protein [Pseudomonas alcaligenes]